MEKNPLSHPLPYTSDKVIKFDSLQDQLNVAQVDIDTMSALSEEDKTMLKKFLAYQRYKRGQNETLGNRNKKGL